VLTGSASRRASKPSPEAKVRSITDWWFFSRNYVHAQCGQAAQGSNSLLREALERNSRQNDDATQSLEHDGFRNGQTRWITVTRVF